MNNRRAQRGQRLKNLALAAVAAQAGCATLVIVFVALFLGLWLDNQLGQRGPCTFGTLVLSVPFSLYAMLRIALGAIQLIQPQSESTAIRPQGTHFATQDLSAPPKEE
jgi:hypothetical protein